VIIIICIFVPEKEIDMRSRKSLKFIIDQSKLHFGRIIVITGARQTGKTTLAKKSFPNHKYISIEDPILAEEYKQLTANQWAETYPEAILDEIQKEPRIIESIKAVYDQYEDPRYILLGSSQILLMKKVRESLAGRSEILELFPLTLPELLTSDWDDEVKNSFFQNVVLGIKNHKLPIRLDNDFVNKQKAYDHYLKFGGYPAISNEKLTDTQRYRWLRNYAKTYLERDVRDLAELNNLEPFKKVQTLFAINTAQLMNFSRLASEAGVSSNTAKRYLEYMNISYQIINLQAWSRNSSKRLSKSPKIHYLDIGVMRTLLQKRDGLNGHEFESAIVAEIYKQVKNLNIDASFYHLRTVDGREVDLLIEFEAGYIAIEIKQSKKVRATDGRHLRKLEEILDKPILHKFLVSNDFDNKVFDDGVEAISALQFLS
jgi:predicted AAA+ superfamily ATPase